MCFDPNQSRDTHLDYIFIGLNSRPVHVRWLLRLDGNGSDYFCTDRTIANFTAQYGNGFGSQHPVTERKRYFSCVLCRIKCRNMYNRTRASSTHSAGCISADISPRSQTADRKRIHRKVRRSPARSLPDQRSKRTKHITAFVKNPIVRGCAC